MVNEVLIQTRITKKPLRTEGRFVEVVHIRLLLNGITLYETNSDIYCLSKQELVEMMLEKSSLLIQALEKVENSKVSIRHGSY
jgi:DNA replication protein DnaD